MSKYLAITELVCVALVRGGEVPGRGTGTLSSFLHSPLFTAVARALAASLPFLLLLSSCLLCLSAADTIAKCRFFVSSCVVQRQGEGGRKGGRRKGEEE